MQLTEIRLTMDAMMLYNDENNTYIGTVLSYLQTEDSSVYNILGGILHETQQDHYMAFRHNAWFDYYSILAKVDG